MMSWSHFENAAKSNNDGINALLQGNHDTAIYFMTNSIQLMKNALSCIQMEKSSFSSSSSSSSGDNKDNNNDDGNTTTDVVSSSSSSHSSLLSSSSAAPQEERTTTRGGSSTTTRTRTARISTSSSYTTSTFLTDSVEIPVNILDSSIDDSTMIFNQAIRIPTCCSEILVGVDEDNSTTTRQGRRPPTEFILNIYISAIIFNLALAHQVKAYSTSFSSSSSSCSSSGLANGGTTTTAAKRRGYHHHHEEEYAVTATTGSADNNECRTNSSSSRSSILLLIKKAEKLYNMVLKLLNCTSYLTSHTALLVKLASINNLTQILHYCPNNDDDDNNNNEGGGDHHHENNVQNILSQMFHFLQNSSSSRSAAQAMFLLQEPQIQGLLVSAFLFKATAVTAAAA